MMLLSGKASGPQGLKRPRRAVAQTPEAPLLPSQQENARNQSYSSQFSLKKRTALLLLWWESVALLMAGLNVFLRSCWFFSRVQSPLFILKQQQSLCCSPDNAVAVSVQNIPPTSSVSVWPPFPAPACLCVTGGRRVISFCKITPLNPYLSCFWTSIMLHSSSSHMCLLFPKLWLPFLRSVSITPEHKALPALSQLFNINQIFGLAGTSPECTERALLKVKVSDLICYLNVFFLCS